MLKVRNRVKFIAGMTVGAVVLGLGSVAFACTTYHGSQYLSWVTGGTKGGGTITGFGGNGLGTDMGWCPGPGGSQQEPSGMLTLDHTNNATIFMSVGGNTCTNSAGATSFGTLPDGQYEIDFYGGNAYTTTSYMNNPNTGYAFIMLTTVTKAPKTVTLEQGDCMAGGVGVTLSSSINVVGGQWTGDVVIPSNDMTMNGLHEFGNMCVSQANPGNTPPGAPQTPVLIV